MTQASPDVIFDHYLRFLRQPVSREVYRAQGVGGSIQALRFTRVFAGCTMVATLGFGRLVSAYGNDFVEVVMAVDAEERVAERLLVQTLFAVAGEHLPMHEGLSVGGLAGLDPAFVRDTGKSAFYFTEPVPFPSAFRRPDQGSRLLLAMPIATAEHEYVKAHGGASFEERLEASGADPFDIRRSAAC